MSYRFKWAFQQALQATLMFSILLAILAFALQASGQDHMHRAATICLLLILPPIAVRTHQYLNVFGVQQVVSQHRGVVLEIGHYTEFMDRFRLENIGTMTYIGHRHGMRFGQGHIFALLYDNGMMVVAQDSRQLQQVHAVLRENWKYHPLVAQCENCQPTMMWTQAANDDTLEVQVA